MRTSAGAIAAVIAIQLFCVFGAHAGALLQFEGRLLRWRSTATAKTEITYAVLSGSYAVPGNKSILSPTNCSAMHAFSDIVAQSPSLSPQSALHELRQAFAAWERWANIDFIEISDPYRANIVIGAQDIPQGKAFANISYRGGRNTAPVAKALGDEGAALAVALDNPRVSVTEIEQAYVCLNPKETWKIGFDGNLAVYDLGYTFTHEIGHALGLDHPDEEGALMGYRYDERVRSLQPSDIAAVQRLYGKPERLR